MHPRIREVIEYLESTRLALHRAVDDIPGHLHRQQPSSEAWSVADVLEHLALVEERIAGLLREQINAARAAGLPPETATSSVLQTFPIEAIVDRTKRRAAGEAVLPRGGADVPELRARLERARSATLDVVRSGDGLALETVVVPHPALGPLNLYAWMLFIGGHEARHTAQLRELHAMLTSTGV